MYYSNTLETRVYIFVFSRSMSMDHYKPLIVPAGADALGQIGLFDLIVLNIM